MSYVDSDDDPLQFHKPCCKKRCLDVFSDQEKTDLRYEFSLKTDEEQDTVLVASMEKLANAHVHPYTPIYNYFVEHHSKKVSICRNAFQKIYGVSRNYLDRIRAGLNDYVVTHSTTKPTAAKNDDDDDDFFGDKGNYSARVICCRQNCIRDITEEDKRKVLEHFEDLSVAKQNDHLMSMLETTVDPQELSSDRFSWNHKAAYQYNILIDSRKRAVCRPAFLSFHKIRRTRLERVRKEFSKRFNTIASNNTDDDNEVSMEGIEHLEQDQDFLQQYISDLSNKSKKKRQSVTTTVTSNEPLRRNLTPIEIKTLLHEYRNQITAFRQGSVRRDSFWRNISDAVLKSGYVISPRQCCQKFASLKRAYFRTKSRNLEENAENVVRFEYFEQFEEFFGFHTTAEEVENDEFEMFDWNDASETNDEGDETDPLYGSSVDQSRDAYLVEHNYGEQRSEEKVWTPYETIRLIENFKKFHRRDSSDSSQIWDDITRLMKAEHITVTPSQCEIKWKALLRYYKNIVETNKPKKKVFLRIEEALQFDKDFKSGKPSTSIGVLPQPQTLRASSQKDKIELRNNFHKKFQKKELEIENLLITENFVGDSPEQLIQEIGEPEYLVCEEAPKFSNYSDDEDLLQDNVEEVDHKPSIVIVKQESAIAVTNNGDFKQTADFQQEILNYLKQKEAARQKRHLENVDLKNKKLRLLEKIANK